VLNVKLGVRSPHFFVISLSPRACQVTTAQCTPTHHPSPSIHTGWVVARRGRTPDLTFNAQTPLRERSPRRPARTFERVNTSPKRDPVMFPGCSIEPSPRRRGGGGGGLTSRLSETLQPERGVGRGSTLFGCLFIFG